MSGYDPEYPGLMLSRLVRIYDSSAALEADSGLQALLGTGRVGRRRGRLVSASVEAAHERREAEGGGGGRGGANFGGRGVSGKLPKVGSRN